MFGSETLEVAIGLAVLFSFMSLFASAARETIEAWYQDRGVLIHKAMAQLFSADGDENSPTLAQFYNSIAISPLFRGAYNGVKGKLPSYITSGNFANTILDMARKEANVAPGTPMADWIDKLGDTRISQLVRLAFQSSGKDPEKTRAFLEAWFNSQMDRVAGWYKRSTHVILLIIGFLSAVALNVDAVTITKHLYRNDAVREVIVAHAQSKPPATLSANSTQGAPAPTDQSQAMANQVGELRDYGFPIGWSWQSQWPTPDPQCALDAAATPGKPCALDTMGVSAILLMVFGWVVTAFGISLGAPFWFDVLNKFMVVRSTVKPNEKSPPEASKDAAPSSPSTTAPIPASAAPPPSPPLPPEPPAPEPPPPPPPQPAPAQPDVRPAR